jgi:hypothetical protein
LGLVQKWLWMRQLDYVGHLLDASLGQVGNLRSDFDRFSACIYGLISALQRETSTWWMEDSFFNKAFKHPVDASRTINIDVSPKLLVFALSISQS